MKSNEKRNLLILVGVGILIILVIWFFTRGNSNKENNSNNSQASQTSQGEFTKKEEDGTIVNTSEKLNQDKNDSGFLVSNISFKEKDGETILEARITNLTGSEQPSFFGTIVLFDKNGNEMGRIPVGVAETQKGETVQVKAKITESYANAYDFKLEK